MSIQQLINKLQMRNITSIICLSLLVYILVLKFTLTYSNPNSNTTIANKTMKTYVSSCNILIAHGGDSYAGFATLIFAYPINFILYSIAKNYSLWIDYNPKYNSLYYDKKYGANTFEYYYESINPFDHCNKTTSTYTTLTKRKIKHGIHVTEPSSIHLWYYHLKKQLSKLELSYYNATFYYKNRLKGSQIVSKYFHLKTEISSQVNEIWNQFKLSNNNNNNIVWLGIHMRGTDKVQKWSIRRVIQPNEYMSYIASFIEYFGMNAKVFFATDDANYLNFVRDNWNKFIKEYEIYSFENIVKTQQNVMRSQNDTAVFNLDIQSKYVMGKEVLLDILLLSKCDWFIHSSSAVSEAVFFNNFKLHSHSVHIEYTQNRQVPSWFN